MSVVTNKNKNKTKIIVSKAIMDSQFHFKTIDTIFKIATLTLEMYCGLQFQFHRAHYHS
jgi:hypothetical protein